MIMKSNPMRFQSFIKISAVATILALCLLFIFACSRTQKMWVPPNVNLGAYNIIGIIDFSTNAPDHLREYMTQNFIQAIQSAQTGVRILALGSEEQVLKSVGRKQLDLKAIQSIGLTYNVDVLFYGQFTISELTPNFHISTIWQSVDAGAFVEASLMTKLWETDSGIILWTDSSFAKEPVASLHADTYGTVSFDAVDPEETCGQLVPQLVYANTADFRPYYVY